MTRQPRPLDALPNPELPLADAPASLLPLLPAPWGALAAVAIGGMAGAVGRYLVGVWVVRHWPERPVLGTLLVNVMGCFLIGIFITLAEQQRLPPLARLLLVTGFLGSLTTFSTFGYETLDFLWSRQRFDLAILNLAGNLLLGLGAVCLGRWLTHFVHAV